VTPKNAAIPTRIGDFDIVGVLGEGGSGIVYDARWGHREIALKVLRPALVATTKEREQFLAEAQRLSEIHHAGVVKVLAVGEWSDGRPFLAMEKLHGETLAKRLERGALPVAQALELFGQLGDAVHALHERGLVHRDLKPENVVLVAGADGREHAVLLDFGIAKEMAAHASTTTQEGLVRGTPAYMAPERFFGQSASVSTDVYELSVMLFAMLAGRLPWEDSGDPDVRLDPRRLADVAPHVPAAVDLEVRRALSTRAQNRPASAAELRTAVLNAAGIQWTPRATVDVKSGPITLPPPMRGADPAALANTISLHGTQRTPTPKVGKVVVAFAGVAVIATGIGIAAHYLSEPGDAIKETAAKAEPAPAPEAGSGTGTGTGTGPALTLADGLSHFPDDELFAFGVRMTELQADTTLRPIIDMFAKSTPGIILRAGADLEKCSFDMRGRTDWLVLGGPKDETAIDVIVSGRWTRAEVEDCLKTAVSADTVLTEGDRVTILRGPRGDRSIGWLDERTFLLSSRPSANAAWMSERLGDTTPPAGKLAPLIAELELGSVLWFAGDEMGGERIAIAQDGTMSGLWGSLDADVADVTATIHIRYPDAKTAQVQKADFEKTAGGLGLGSDMGSIAITQEPDRPDIVHVEMKFTRMIAAILIESLAAGEMPQ
jgi:serine/threonine-protein kinase